MGVAIGLSCGFFVHKVAAGWLVTSTSILCACAPLFMAVMDPKWTYWYMAFWAQALSPISVSVLVTVGMLIVSDVFPDKSQALAGAVFNTFAQLGASIGICVMSVISASVTAKSKIEDKNSPAALMEGYRVSFWTLFACMLAAAVIGGLGLRNGVVNGSGKNGVGIGSGDRNGNGNGNGIGNGNGNGDENGGESGDGSLLRLSSSLSTGMGRLDLGNGNCNGSSSTGGGGGGGGGGGDIEMVL